MFRRKLAILMLIWFFLLFMKQGIAAETYPSQRDGAFVIAGQVTGGFLAQGTGGMIGLLLAIRLEKAAEKGLLFPAGFLGGMAGALFGCAGGVYAVGEIFGSGGGSFKKTLKWSLLTPIGATVGLH